MDLAPPLLPPDPHDFLAVVHALLAWCRHHLTASGEDQESAWRLVRLVPRLDGEVWIDLASHFTVARLRWGAPPPPALRSSTTPAVKGAPGRNPAGEATGAPAGPTGGDWAWGRLSSSEAVPAPVRRRLVASLRRALAHPAFAVLRYVNRREQLFWYDEGVVDRLLAGRLAVSRSRYGEALLGRIHQETAEAFELDFETPRGIIRYQVAAPGFPAPAHAVPVLAHPLFTLHILQDCRSEAERRAPAYQVERMLGLVLCRAVHTGMRLRGGARLAGPGPDEFFDPRCATEQSLFRGAPVSTSRWGNTLQWAQFFSDFEIARAGLCGVDYRDPVAMVVHGEPECLMVEPTAVPRPITFAVPPWSAVPRDIPAGSCSFTSLLGERQALLGGATQFARLLHEAVASQTVDLVLVNDTCLSRIIGDDVASVVEDTRRRSQVPLVLMDTERGDPEEVYADLVAKWCATAAPAKPDEAPSVSFFGYPDVPARRELDALLSRLGVAVAAHLLPDLGRALVTAYYRGRAQVVYPWQRSRELHERLFARMDAPVIPVPAPYGLRDTKAWLFGIAGTLGRSHAAAEWWAGEEAVRQRRTLQDLRQRVAGMRVAVVVRADEVERVIRPERCYGVKLLPLLAELGFGLDVVLVLGAEPESNRTGPAAALGTAVGESAEQRVRGALGPEADLRVHRVGDAGELEATLRQGDFHGVYTELRDDTRVTRAGKVPVHLDLLEMGLSGAVRTAERLLHRCDWAFFRRYRRHLFSAEGVHVD